MTIPLAALCPSPAALSPNLLARQLDLARQTLPLPPDDVALAFCASLSSLLLNDPRSRAFPALQALGFWLRPAHLSKLLKDHLMPLSLVVRRPRGVVFQIPPRNVDSLFGYAALLSLLCGNVTLVRLNPEHSKEQSTLLSLIQESMAQMPETFSQRLVFISYERDEALTKALSALCDLRMVWGSDETINSLRRIPLPPLAIEASFADRFSMAALNAATYLEAKEPARAKLAARFARDLFAFDQMACTSPRLLFWCGNAAETTQAAQDFYPRLAQQAPTQHDCAGAVAKTSARFLALHDLDVLKQKIISPALTILILSGATHISAFKDTGFGHGLLLEATGTTLQDLAAYLSPKDQTLTSWGFTAEALNHFITKTPMAAFTRFVPVGQAHDFDVIWDGHNLFELMTKPVRVAL